jgi:cell fate regulator YaaT (PSP1 superfamily)
MPRLHLVRTGSLGQIAGFISADQTCYPRGSRVVVRTDRGLELGQVLTPPEGEQEFMDVAGTILRGMTSEDELLETRLLKNRQAAFEACSIRIAALRLPTILMDVEHLFDGQTLVFYFLGEISPQLEALTGELTEAYESHVEFRKFTETLAVGCGPDCGTDSGAGCGSCDTGCAVASACGSARRPAPAKGAA